MKCFSLTDSKNTQNVGDSFRKCNLVFNKMSAVSRPSSLYSRQSIICLNVEVKSSAAFSMFAKHLTRFVLTVCFISYLQNWVSVAECGLQLRHECKSSNTILGLIALRKLLFLGRLITEPKMAQSVRSLFMSRAESYFDASVTSVGVLPSIIEALNKYDLFHFFVTWFHDSTFPTYSNWKWISEKKSEKL